MLNCMLFYFLNTEVLVLFCRCVLDADSPLQNSDHGPHPGPCSKSDLDCYSMPMQYKD